MMKHVVRLLQLIAKYHDMILSALSTVCRAPIESHSLSPHMKV